ncbi:MAG: hypothetical protein F4Y14_14825 [Acidobacteria bacterium]|nr:hypothetical protein [Acidobacteriota bacterium]
MRGVAAGPHQLAVARVYMHIRGSSVAYYDRANWTIPVTGTAAPAMMAHTSATRPLEPPLT